MTTTKNEKEDSGILGKIGVISSVGSVLLMIIYGTWFVAVIEKRITLLEKENFVIEKEQEKFESSIDAKLERMELRIERIYSLVSSSSK